jgi:site-specific recombinase XerD
MQNVKAICKNSKSINGIIAKRVGQVSAIFYNAILKDEPLDVDTFKELLLNEKVKHDFITFMLKAIREQDKLVTHSTIKNYVKSYNHLKAFRAVIPFYDINIKLVTNFEKYLKKLGLKHNTVNGYLKQLKKFIRIAISEGYPIQNPFEHYQLRWHESTPVWLEPFEIEKMVTLYNREDIPYHFKDTLQMFLFMLGTGLRISDTTQLNYDMIVNDTIIIRIQKTQRYKLEETFLISDFASQFLPIQVGEEKKIFKYKTCQSLNKNLKSICEHLNIKKDITSHTARHTYATTLLLAGANIEVVSKLLGHKSLKDTMIYVHITKQAERKNLALFDKFMK